MKKVETSPHSTTMVRSYHLHQSVSRSPDHLSGLFKDIKGFFEMTGIMIGYPASCPPCVLPANRDLRFFYQQLINIHGFIRKLPDPFLEPAPLIRTECRPELFNGGCTGGAGGYNIIKGLGTEKINIMLHQAVKGFPVTGCQGRNSAAPLPLGNSYSDAVCFESIQGCMTYPGIYLIDETAGIKKNL